MHQKRVDRFYPRFIEHQRRFARVMLETINPYNQLAPKDDPGVAFVEINNENSIMSLWPGQAMGQDLEKLPVPYVEYLQTRWNQWLKTKYASDEQLRAAWSKNVEQPGASVVDPTKPWYLNRIDGAQAELESHPSQVDGALMDAAIRIQKQTGTDWHVQLIHPDIDLESDRTYSVSFECRSDQPGVMRISSDRDHDDYRNVGLSQTVQTMTQWAEHAFTFTATNPEAQHSRLVFHLGLLQEIELRDVRMNRGSSKPIVAPGTSLAQGISRSRPLPALCSSRIGLSFSHHWIDPTAMIFASFYVMSCM